MSSVFGSNTSNAFGSNTSNAFGSTANNAQKPLFGSLNTNTTSQAPSGGGLFGSTAQPQTGGGIFGSSTSQAPSGGGLFGSTTSQAPSGGGIFGSSTSQAPSGGGLFGSTAQPQTGGGIFGSSTSQAPSGGGLFGSTTSQAPSGGGLFGSTSQPQTGGGLFGSAAPQAQTGGGLFGSTAPQAQTGGGLFGSTNPPQQSGGGPFGSTAQPQQSGGGLFGGTTNQQQNQPQQGGGIFGGFGQNTQQQQQQNQQQQSQQIQPQHASLFGQTQGAPRLFVTSENGLPQKSVTAQMELAFQKWNPQSPETLFQTYLYNNVPVDQAPFYGPTSLDNETKWEEALAKKPSPGAVPILAQGFQALGNRMIMQVQALETLRGRLHEINEGLNSLLQRHDLEISIRAAECRRKHLRISQQCLSLAAKTQILRNRGYAMDSAEEELRKKLMQLERRVFDPALNGRGEEIWARMVSVRERGRQLQREFERAGSGLVSQGGKGLDEDVMAKAKKILEDYSSQLAHLTREMAQIQKDWAEWEAAKPPPFAR